MRRLFYSWILLTLVAPLASAAPTGLLHEPPGVVPMGEALVMELEVEGVSGDQPDVRLFYRRLGSSSYTPEIMEARGDGRFHCEIPSAATRTPQLEYYIEVNGPDGRYRSQLGSAKSPLGVVLLEPAVDGGSRIAEGVIALLVLSVIGGGVMLHDRRRRNRDERERSRGVVIRHASLHAGVASKPEKADRPRRPSRRPSTAASLSGSDLKQLRARVNDEAHRLGCLCAAAWLLLRRGRKDDDISDRLDEARAMVGSLRQKLKQGLGEQAAQIVEQLEERIGEMESAIAAIDSRWSADDLERAIGVAHGVTAEMLGRLVEYYANRAELSPPTRAKALVAGLALLKHDGIEDADIVQIRESFRRRDLLSNFHSPFPAALEQHGRELQVVFAAVCDPDERDLQKMEENVDSYLSELGEHFRGAPGLSAALAVTLAWRKAVVTNELRQTGSFERIAQELRTVDDTDPDRAVSVSEIDHPDAIALLREIEQELSVRIESDDPSNGDFLLDELELRAARANDESDWSRLLFHCMVCRCAMDRMARRHAQAQRQDGVRPPTLPQELGATLLRKASQLTRDLRDENERDRMHGNHERVRETDRYLHRFSRAHLGLTLLDGESGAG